MNHFNPFEKLFVGHLVGCVLSLVAMSVTGLAAYQYATTYGLTTLLIHDVVE